LGEDLIHVLKRGRHTILSGETVTAAAKTAKVNRSTVHRWLNDPGYLANLKQHRSEAREAQHDRLASLAFSAIEVVKEALGPVTFGQRLWCYTVSDRSTSRHAVSDL